MSTSGKSSSSPDDRDAVITGCHSGALCSEDGEVCMWRSMRIRSVEVEEWESSKLHESNESSKSISNKGSDSGEDKSESGESSSSPDDHHAVTGCRSGASCSEEGELCMRRGARSEEAKECERVNGAAS